MEMPSHDHAETERQQLQQAMAALEAQRAVLGDAVVAAALASMQEKLAKLDALEGEKAPQLKFVTILFMDIAGSTRMSQGLDAEDTLAVMDGALQRFGRVIERFNGRVLRFMGDGLMAVFGAPVAREDDAERAVHASLSLLDEANRYGGEVQERWGLPDFTVRVGLNTGQVVVGAGVEAENTIMGMAINLAARMESSAPPGCLLISHDTYRHVRGLFDVQAQPPLLVKGKEEPLRTYIVQRLRPRGEQLPRRGIAGVQTGLVGRDDELEILQSAFRQVIDTQQVQLVTVVGEPGIGKSRLLAEFERWVDFQQINANCFHCGATEQMSGTPYALLRDLFAEKYRILESDNAVQVQQKLEDAFTVNFGEDAGVKAHVVGALLGFTSAAKVEKDDPEQLRQQALFYMQQYFAALAESAPVLLVFDDIHWADSPSLDALRELIRRCRSSRLLLICLARFRLFDLHPEWEKPIAGEDVAVTRLDLAPLSQISSQELVEAILSRVKDAPVELCDLLVKRAEGNPYYIEELVNMLIDDGAIIPELEGVSWQVDLPRLKGLRIPPTLTAVLQARLELLPAEARLALQQASVVGRIFWDSVIQAISMDGFSQERELAFLTSQRVIRPEEVSQFEGSNEYRFIHALFQDMVYETVLKEKRRLIHAGVANWLVKAAQSSGRVEEFSASIARHFVLAQAKAAAANWSMVAGERAVAQGAFPEALQFFNQALDLLQPGDLEMRWRALLGRDEVLGVLGDVAARQADDAALLALARQIGNESYLAEAYIHQGYYIALTGDDRAALQAYDAALQAARRAGSLDLQAEVLGLKLASLTHLGELAQAANVLQDALEVLPAVKDDLLRARMLTNLSVYLTTTGDLSRAVQLLDQTLAITRRLGNSAGETLILDNLGYYYLVMGLVEQGYAALERALSISQKIGFSKGIVYSQLNLGLAYVRQGNSSAARQVLEQAVSGALGVDPSGAAVGYSYLGLVDEFAGDSTAAGKRFAEARHRLEALGMHGNAQDAQAGLARCSLGIGETANALIHAMGVWEHLVKHGSQALEFPILAYQTCAKVFNAAGDLEKEEDAIWRGYQELLERAGKISDPDLKKAFLENIPEHRAISREWERITNANDI
jgi:class 3 adenylate cyclase/tetratricopeptide (TPR) repeat protein